jgi:hypothetical protein
MYHQWAIHGKKCLLHGKRRPSKTNEGMLSTTFQLFNLACDLELPISNAVKMFLWKACNNILPTKENLLQRRVVSDNLCPICTLSGETTAHILWHCPSAQDVWCSSPLRFQKSNSMSLNFKCLFEEMIDRFEYEELAPWAIIARTI